MNAILNAIPGWLQDQFPGLQVQVTSGASLFRTRVYMAQGDKSVSVSVGYTDSDWGIATKLLRVAESLQPPKPLTDTVARIGRSKRYSVLGVGWRAA
jgi:hypothetical protein